MESDNFLELGSVISLILWTASWSSLIVAGFYVLSRLKELITMKWKSKQLPGPPESWIPLVGNALEIGRTQHNELLALLLKWAQTYGPVYKVWVFHKLYIIISCPVLMKQILSSPLHTTKSSDYDVLHPWLGEGLLTSNGEKWKDRRKCLVNEFSNTKFLENSLKVINQKSIQLTRRLESKLLNSQHLFGGFNITPLLTETAFGIICETGMGINYDIDTPEFKNYLAAATRVTEIVYKKILQPWRNLPILKYFIWENYEMLKCINSLHHATRKIVQERREHVQEKEEKGSFLDIILSMDNLSDSDVFEEANTFLFGGHDTIAANLCWTILNLAAHRDCQTKLQDELDRVLDGCENGYINKEHLSQMKYLECCIKESLRVFPSVPAFNRKLLQDFNGYPQGSILSFNVFLMHRDPKIFKDPESFLPERFMQGSNDYPPYSYLPFSGGTRGCLGKKFAVMEEMVLLARLFYNYEFSLRGEGQLDLDQLQWDLVLRPLNGTNIRIFKRPEKSIKVIGTD